MKKVIKSRIFLAGLVLVLLLALVADTGYVIYKKLTDRPSDRAAALSDEEPQKPSPTSELSGREWLEAILASGSDEPANAESKAAEEELTRTGTVTYHGHTYKMPWYRAVSEWVWDLLPELRSTFFGTRRKW